MWSGNYVLRGKYTRFTLSSGPTLYWKSLKFQNLLGCVWYEHNIKHHPRESFASWSSIWHCLPFLKLKKNLYTLQLATRPFDVMGTAVSQSYAVCQRMLHYVQSFEHYMTFEVFFLSVVLPTSIPSSVLVLFYVWGICCKSDTCNWGCSTLISTKHMILLMHNLVTEKALRFYGSSALDFRNRKLLTLDAYWQVLEPNWHSMHSSLVVSKSIDEVRWLRWNLFTRMQFTGGS